MRTHSSGKKLAVAVTAALLLTACTPASTSTENDAASASAASTQTDQSASAEATPAEGSLTLSGPEGPEGTDFWNVFGAPEGSESAGDIHTLQERSDAPAGSQGWNIVYVSDISPDTKTYVSGEVYVPTAPSDEPRDIILWNHETTGLADNCAPSRRTVSEERVPALEELLELGHIVVMSDYPGQGLPGPTYYMAGAPNARASLDALKALDNLSEIEHSGRYVQYGWSQGGQTTMQAEAIAADYAPDFEPMGAALIAPAVRIKDLTERSMQQPELAGYVISTLPGIKAAYPDLKYRDFLSPEAMEHLPDLSFGCWDVWETGSTIEDAYTPTALQDGTDWADAMGEIDDFTPAGSVPFAIYQGSADNTTPVSLTKREFENLCEAGSPVEYHEFEGLDHSPVVPEAAELFPAWAQDRFDGKPAQDDCS